MSRDEISRLADIAEALPTIWNTVDTDVPALAAAVERLIENAG